METKQKESGFFNVRGIVVYPAFFRTAVIKNVDTGKYGCVLLIDKRDTAQIKKIGEAIRKCAEKSLPSFDEGVFKELNKGFKNGALIADKKDWHPYWVMRPKSKIQPEVVTQTLSPVTDPSAIRSGSVCMISVRPYFYSNVSTGIQFNLGNVQLLGDSGKQFASGTSASEDFDSIDTEEAAVDDFYLQPVTKPEAYDDEAPF